MNRVLKKILVFCMITLLLAGSVPAALAADTSSAAPGSSASVQSYVLSFRPGAYGTFTKEAQDYLSKLGTVQVSAATGNLYVQVAAGTVIPGDFETMMRTFITPNDSYYYKSGLDLGGQTVVQDEELVAQYGILSGTGVKYTVRYLDSKGGNELAASYTGYANKGDVIIFRAKDIDRYGADAAQKTLIVGDAETIDFIYTEGVTTVTSTTTQIINLGGNVNVVNPGNNPANPGGDNANNPATNPGENINENSTPLNPGSAANSTTSIEDNSTPLAPGENAGMSALTGILIGGGAGLLLILLILLVLANAKKKKKNQNI